MDIKDINKNIDEVELLLKESMRFFTEEDFLNKKREYEDSDYEDFDDENSQFGNQELTQKKDNSVRSYIDNIRKYSIDGLSALCDNPDSEEYQLLKKIFQMCDKRTDKKDNLSESHRLFGVLKDSKKVIFETYVDNKEDIKDLKKTIVAESISKGFNPSNIRIVSEKKIIH